MRLERTDLPGGARTWLVFGKRKIRLNRAVFAIVTTFATLSVMWPGYAFFSEPEPFVLGLPLPFAWLIMWVIIMFMAMFGLYLSDNKSGDA